MSIRKTIVALMMILCLSPVLAQVHPITVLKKTASSTGTLATPTYDLATVTLSNLWMAKPVYLTGTPTITLLGTSPVIVTGTPSVNIVGTIPVTIQGALPDMSMLTVPQVDALVSTAVATNVLTLAGRRTIILQNLSETESIWFNIGVASAVVSSFSRLFPATAYLGDWDSSVSISYVSSVSVPICIIQGR